MNQVKYYVIMLKLVTCTGKIQNYYQKVARRKQIQIQFKKQNELRNLSSTKKKSLINYSI